MIESVIANVLANDPKVLAAGIPTYTGGAGNLAIFAVTVPRDCQSLAIKVQSTGTDGFDTQGKNGFVAQMDVSVYGPKNYSYTALRAIGRIVKKTLHHSSLAGFIETNGFTTLTCIAREPFDHQDAEGFPGVIIRVTATVIER